ncbi:MAG: 23S rRNA (guanosine(2251)-2'-O)-methyltransferase RlmB [Clostridiales bacterium]|nr:23S rRNA (guanosine(2251)-2'-O)-methyltransferase RlmB [Clostridiales bacterium]
MENKRQKQTQPADEAVIVGRNPVLELLKSGREIEKIYIQRGSREGSITKIFAEARARSIIVSEVDKRRLDELSGGNAHQGVAAIASVKEYVSVEDIVNFAAEKGEKPLIVVCDGVEDPHNIGATIRCAEGAGAHGIILGKRHSALLGQTVFKSSAGAAEYVPIAKVSNIASAIDELKELGVWTFAAEADGECCYDTDFDCPAAIVLGSEGQGVSRLVKEKCDFVVSIPMHGKVNSLNVSTAAAVLLFEAVRKRK